MESILAPRSPTKKKRFHHGDLRNAIMDAVAQLIGEKRSLAFQLKEVAELVGTTQPAIYKHFESKDALLVETAVTGYKLQRAFREFAMETSGGSPLADILAIGEAYVLFSIRRPGYFLLIKNLETNEILSSQTYLQERDLAVNRITELVQRCIEDGLFADVSVELARTVLQSTAYGLAHLYITGQIDLTAKETSRDGRFPTEVFARSLSSLLSGRGQRELILLLKSRSPQVTFDTD